MNRETTVGLDYTKTWFKLFWYVAYCRTNVWAGTTV